MDRTEYLVWVYMLYRWSREYGEVQYGFILSMSDLTWLLRQMKPRIVYCI